MRALRIDSDATVTDLHLTETDARAAIREVVGAPDAVDRGRYTTRGACCTSTAAAGTSESRTT